ncbi:MAG TPA: DNA-formamidopyrimidine glycosylase family protein [Fimbriiglobus sp.]
MPELPDITVYVEALQKRLLGRRLLRVRVRSPFLVRTFDPPLDATFGKEVQSVRRIGKRIAVGFEDDLWIVLHLMIAGRLHWKSPNAEVGGKIVLAAFDFAEGTLLFTEAGSKKRASLHVLRGEAAVHAHDPGGLDIYTATTDAFREILTRENRTLKRALTDPKTIDGIGNSYSDEILHRAKLPPLALTKKLKAEDFDRLHTAAKVVLTEFTERLRAEAGDGFPEKVTAFRKEMAVHGKFGKPCPVCGVKVHRIRYADNETNYCPKCQTGGKILADRVMSRLLGDDRPKHIDEEED